jgi:hypothetical protein
MMPTLVPVLLVVLLGSATAAVPPPPPHGAAKQTLTPPQGDDASLLTTATACPTCTWPKWSWDTLPAFFHGSEHNGTDRGGFSAEALQTILKFPMVTIEKWQGDLVEPKIFEEDAWQVSAAQIKAHRPNTTVVVWMDSLRIYTADKALNPGLKRPCAQGHFRPAEFLESGGKMDGKLDPASPYLLQNSSGLPALASGSGCHVFDHTKPMVRSYWIQMCLNATKSGFIDGCGADASFQNAHKWHLSPETAALWQIGHETTMRQTTAALGPGGVLLGKDPWEVGDYVNGALHEGCAAENATVNTLRNLTAHWQRMGERGKRLIYQCHGKQNNTANEIAAFLIGAGEGHYYGTGSWDGDAKSMLNHRPAEMDKKLGAPDGPAVYDNAAATWSRSFATGTSVSFNAITGKGSIRWAG